MAQNKVKKVMHEFKEGELHSGSKHGPKVTSRKQAIAIGLSEAGKSKARKMASKASGRRIQNTKNLESIRKIKSHEREY